MSDQIIRTIIQTGIIAAAYGLLEYIYNKYKHRENLHQHPEAENEPEYVKRILESLEIDNLQLTEHERIIASQVLDASSLSVTYEDVAGLDDVILNIKASVLFPLENYSSFSKSELSRPPLGVLLYGPSGCGKTMIAEATAKEVDARFIKLDVSTLGDKFYGESRKLISAVFSLAGKIQPTIIFMDEIDAMLRTRSSEDHEETTIVKSLFLNLWGGFSTEKHWQVVIMGATNRKEAIDEAILRRMPLQFHIGPPNALQREKILKSILRDEEVEEDVDLNELAQQTSNFVGSDLKYLCQSAAKFRVIELTKANKDMAHAAKLRLINAYDFTKAFRTISIQKNMM